jgi:hypothetical protein
VAVHREQLHRRVDPRRLGAGAVALDERLVLIAERPLEGEVDRVEKLAAAAEVDADGRRPAPPVGLLVVLAEHLHVRVPEPIDRLVLVPYSEQGGALAIRRSPRH